KALEKARVVSIDPAVGLLVLDAGRSTGVRIGTPVAILRGEKPIYSAMIVDVREGISGALLQNRLDEKLEASVGDRVRVLPDR
ncbi:MAG: hypothetical protein AAF226_13245, partial [Verrucomicrobiota bacterium]